SSTTRTRREPASPHSSRARPPDARAGDRPRSPLRRPGRGLRGRGPHDGPRPGADTAGERRRGDVRRSGGRAAAREPPQDAARRARAARAPRLRVAPPRADRAAERRAHAQPDQGARPRRAAARAARREGGVGPRVRTERPATRPGAHRARGAADRRAESAQPRRAILVGSGWMSFAAEPYGVFVDDLVAGLTGGVTREDFVFLTENAPFRLAGGADVVPDTVRISGLTDAEFFRFRAETDFHVDPDGTIR